MTVSTRSLELFKTQKRFKAEIPPKEIQIALKEGKVEHLNYGDHFLAAQIVFLEAIGEISEGKVNSQLKQLSLREVIAYLKNHHQDEILPIEWLYLPIEKIWEDIFEKCLNKLNFLAFQVSFSFDDQLKFREMALVEKIKHVKTFLHSKELEAFVSHGGKIELLDLEEETIFILLEMDPVLRAGFLDWLHLKMAEVFREPRLNIVVE